MAGVTGKRKREDVKARPSAFKKPAVNGHQKTVVVEPTPNGTTKASHAPSSVLSATQDVEDISGQPISIQIVTGSYDRVLHGFSATIPTELLEEDDVQSSETVTYSDTFLFAAHTASIRCLAISPATKASKRFLATGSSDERINTYSISTVPPLISSKGNLPSLGKTTITESSSNRTLGSLSQHDRAVTRLIYQGKGKLFSAAEDNTIAIARTHDGVVLSSFKAPIPKPHGRPSGDTAAPGEVPTGINDFNIHPTSKIMLSVGRGERSLRLWNLMTGKKAGVLNFDRDLLGQVGEGRFSSGEGRRVLWGGAKDSYVVGFERGAVFFGDDSVPKAVIKPSPLTKLHQMHFLPGGDWPNLLAISTEDGRVLFYDIASTPDQPLAADGKQKLPAVRIMAQLGGVDAGITGRVKDFEIVSLSQGGLLVITASSDGAVRLWHLSRSNLAKEDLLKDMNDPAKSYRQVGRLVSTHETGNRITCVGAFTLDGKAGVASNEEEEDAAVGEERDEESSSEDE